MSDDLPQRLRDWGSRLRGVRKNKLILVILNLMLVMGLFFYSFSQASTTGEKVSISNGIFPEVIDPLSRIGRGIIEDNRNGQGIPLIQKMKEKKIVGGQNSLEKNVLNLVSGHPIENMAEAISQQDKAVASFLVAIARKESSWGEHAPSKNGKDCYNYWGYKGTDNPTESGYSCFDSPEQAVSVVGGRVKKLINQGIDTPEKMLVWKCGSTCAGQDQKDVRKWVADVSQYMDKIN